MKTYIRLLCIGILTLLLSACQANNSVMKVQEPADWAIYWYLCGSDLESKHGAASLDIDEMLAVKLPEHVKVVIETGGAAGWKNGKVKEDVLTRFVYDQNGLKKVGTKELSNMGE